MTAFRPIFVLAALIAVAAAFVSIENVKPDEVTLADRHLRLLKSEPAADTVVAAPPGEIHLWFSEEPAVRVTTVQVTVAGQTRRLEKVTADAEDGKHIIAAVDTAGPPGAWTVAWRTMSRDGHVVSGEVAFRVEAQR
jgi:methionine-rich copper-binding protein CopC